MNRAAQRSKCFKGWIAVVCLAGAMIVVLSLNPMFRGSAAGELLQILLGMGSNDNLELLNQLNASWSLPEEYSLEVITVDGIVMEWLRPNNYQPDRAVLQLHGGAYMRSLEDNGATYRRAALQYAKLSGGAVLTVDYRVAPEHPYPAALEDAVAAYNWLLDQGILPEQIIIAGDSAGGGLTLATALYLRDNRQPLPKALITMSAWTNLDYRLWTPAYVGNARADDPYISPIYGEYYGFPPMLMQVGGDERLLNDTVAVAQKAREAGVDVRQTTYPGMFHVFQMLFPELPEANAAWVEVAEFINEIWH
ncbi:MAG: alpha/beta hydrolase [Limnochordia bacterium]|jgi:monoterpene epsilon-lactone hydrolase|nr:alpha/beta hydrolase [Bacillota bacterium]HQD71174.1 alpha/beta hydrolase [Limnochordia bacterium]HXK97886.1 alpha/beta hydrolase [Limnochordia bacterium]